MAKASKKQKQPQTKKHVVASNARTRSRVIRDRIVLHLVPNFKKKKIKKLFLHKVILTTEFDLCILYAYWVILF